MHVPVGLLVNFGAATLREGLHRVVNDLPPSASPRLRVNRASPPPDGPGRADTDGAGHLS